eukprot:m.47433 g.47433  ORF g.47433 m.47433 type:complete len:385 (-) comp15222_c0_seq1:170-1324(-)
MAELTSLGIRLFVVMGAYMVWYPVVTNAFDIYSIQIDHEAWCEPIFNGKLTCLPRNMFMVPRDIPEDVEVFCGTGNRISATANALEGLRLLPYLTVVKLNKNQIDKISPRVFEALSSLQALELKGNFLTTIGSSDFGAHHSLHTLMLQRNRILTIETGAFSHLEALETLMLDGNHVAGIAPRAWPPVSISALRTLSMHGGNPSNCSVMPYTVGEITCDCTELHGSEDGTYCVYGGQIVPTYAKIDRIAAALAEVEGPESFSDDVIEYVYKHRRMAITGGQHTRNVFILSQTSTPYTHISNQTWENVDTKSVADTPTVSVLCGVVVSLLFFYARYLRSEPAGKSKKHKSSVSPDAHPGLLRLASANGSTRRHRVVRAHQEFQFEV